jgi:hypothetical protein
MKCLPKGVKSLTIEYGRKKEHAQGEFSLQAYQLNYEVKLLLINQSNEKEVILYNSNPNYWQMSKIGPRPPYYCNPRYEQYFPKI